MLSKVRPILGVHVPAIRTIICTACLEPPYEGLVGKEQVALLAPHAYGLQTPLDGVFEPRLARLVPPVTLVEGCSVRLYLHSTPIELCECVCIALCCHNLEQNMSQAKVLGLPGILPCSLMSASHCDFEVDL